MYIVLKAGLMYEVKLKGNSTRLQFGGTRPGMRMFKVFMSTKLIRDAIRTPPRYTIPLISELKAESITKKKLSNNGDIAAPSCMRLLKFNFIAIFVFKE